MRKPVALLLMGPTAAGKTDLALHLADSRPCRLISVDSVMVYRGLDIGSAKPDAATLARYPHALVDIRDPAEPYSAADFREDALRLIAEAAAAGELPVLVGGTSMYFKALCMGLGNMPTADAALRQRLEQEAAIHGWPALHARLATLDPVAASRMHPTNRQRIQRALEVIELSGRPLSSFWGADESTGEIDWDARAHGELPFQPLAVALDVPDRQQLHERINRRFDAMLAAGLIAEVEALRQRGDLHPGLPAIRAVGYRQVWEYLEGEGSYETLRERGKAATRQLAKRQLTWLRSWPAAHRVVAPASPGELPGALSVIHRLLDEIAIA